MSIGEIVAGLSDDVVLNCPSSVSVFPEKS
jgi:hypothetical protein